MRYLINFSYDGSKFYGYQKQKEKETVQEKLESVLSNINNSSVSVVSSGRTDKGVHANNAYAHFDLNNYIDTNKLKKVLNSCSSHIYVKNIQVISNNFHARFDVKKKEYIYIINIGTYNPIEKDYVYQYNKYLNICKMRKGLTYLKGKHDFKSFTKSNKDIINYTREIYKCKIKREKNYIIISFLGNGFLRYMIRNMIGVLIEIGENKLNPKEIKNIILARDRCHAKKTAPSQGLYLNKVFY